MRRPTRPSRGSWRRSAGGSAPRFAAPGPERPRRRGGLAIDGETQVSDQLPDLTDSQADDSPLPPAPTPSPAAAGEGSQTGWFPLSREVGAGGRGWGPLPPDEPANDDGHETLTPALS